MQQNLEQVRAAHADQAIKRHPTLSRSAVSKLPALILQNGLLASSAFCNAEGSGENRGHLKTALDETAAHLAQRGHLEPSIKTVKGMIDELCKRDSHHLQRATAEAMAFIAYLKRFAPKD
jgi:CRISPR/Cas system CMR-associated protein Cmr5 small subunit